MQPVGPDEGEFYKKYTVKVNAEAKIPHLTDFLFQVEKENQLIRLTEFNLSPLRSNPSVLRINMTLTKITLN
jgi:hypothetical protein